MNKRPFISIFLLIHTLIQAQPVVYMDLPGLLGNRLWGFCVAKIIAYELGYDLYCKSIYGFPNTYCYQPSYPNNAYPWTQYGHDQDIDIKSIINNKTSRNIKLNGCLQRYAYLEPYADLIKNDWLKIDQALLHKIDPEDIVAHVRIYHPNDAPPMNFDYYEKALSMAHYKRLYICTNAPLHPYIKNFERYNPIVVTDRDLNSYLGVVPLDETSKLNMDDFGFMASFNKIIIAYSTYSWWAAYLSQATEIYAPYKMGAPMECGKVNENRYIYIDTDVR